MAREAPQPQRPLPHNVDAEKSVLGAILVNNENYYDVVESLAPEDFYLEAHRLIFRKMSEIVDVSKAVDLITLQDALERDLQLETSGGIGYLAGLMDGIPHLVNIDHYIQIIREKALFRQMIRAANQTMLECFDQTDPAEEVLDRGERRFFELSERRSEVGLTPVAEMREDTRSLIERLYTERELVTGLATGFNDLDRMTSGLQPADLVILAARPSMGKTAFSLNLAQHVAIGGNRPVAIFSLEMSKPQLLMRMLCAEALVDAHRVRTGYLSKEDFTKLVDALGRVASAPIYIDDSSTLTIMQMRAKARRLKAESGLGLVIVDYLQLMSGFGRFENRNQEISGISRGLKALAKELHVPVMALSQLSRAPEQRAGRDHRPQLSDLRESGSIEQDADLVAFIYREEVYKPSEDNEGRAELIISKQRNGPTGTVRLAFQKQFTRFDTLLEGY
jgi:replicative DNA helicase